MPELPEIHRFAKLIQSIQSHQIVSHSGELTSLLPSSSPLTIVTCLARGKQLLLTLRSVSSGDSTTLVFGFGLVGRFALLDEQSASTATHVRASLRLDDTRHLVLIDSMRMASFSKVTDFDRKRGPDPVLEWPAFAQNVRDAIAQRRLSGEIGSSMLNQAYFNGIGNYLRAELLHRARIFPLDPIERVAAEAPERFDELLNLCRDMPLEILRLDLNKYGDEAEQRRFKAWLAVYESGVVLLDKSKRKMYVSKEAESNFKLGATTVGATAAAAEEHLEPTEPHRHQLQVDIVDEIVERVPLSSDNVATLLLLVREFSSQRLLSADDARLLKRSLLALSSGNVDASAVALGAWRGLLDAFDVSRDRADLIDTLHEVCQMHNNRGFIDGSSIRVPPTQLNIIDESSLTFSSSNYHNLIHDGDKPTSTSTSTSIDVSGAFDLSSLLKQTDLSWWNILQHHFDSPSALELCRRLNEEAVAGHTILPARDEIFNAFRLPLRDVRVVILGQDPYPAQTADGTPHAMGLAFSVHPSVHPLPGSLSNIFEELYNDVPGFQKPATGDLGAWMRRGVFLLNTALTVRANAAASHSFWGWHQFTDEVIRQLCRHGRDTIVFILWGRHATAKASLIGESSGAGQRRKIVACAHPSPLSARNGFFGSKCFTAANELLVAAGESPIDWKL
jgi:uracil-DNA glycosylase